MGRITLQGRFNNFTTWIRPDDADAARDQRDLVRKNIRGQADADGLIVRSTPNSGSFAKGTGLRRHMHGKEEHEGQDIDCPFVISRKDEDGDALTELLGRFEKYAKASYPDTPREPSKSSIKLSFKATKRDFDLVPMLAVDGKDDEQVLLRANGERRRTSVQKHVDFVSRRTKKSQEVSGPVAFNECVRHVKWWREFKAGSSNMTIEVPTFLLDLLCAKAFDEVGVRADYADTLALWFDKIASYAADRTEIAFRDYVTPNPAKAGGAWKVIDPVNGENNAVPSAWGGIEFDTLRDWAREARDKLRQAIWFDAEARDPELITLMVDVFGAPFKNHSEP